jgi:hypothetical protein
MAIGSTDSLPTRTGDGSHRLDSEESQERLKNLQRYRRQARCAQEPNRCDMAMDEDFYDGIQLDPDDISIIEKRGQDPLVFNLTKNTCNWVIGTERKNRVDYSVKPRRAADAADAKIKTNGLKYVQDMNHAEYVRSLAFSDAVISGLGWIEIGARPGDEVIYYEKENWRYMWFDHLGGDNTKAWRYVLREKWTDTDIAQAMFPDRKDDIELLSTGVNSLYPYLPEDPIISDTASEFDLETDVDALLGGAYDGLRERIKLCEMWYRVPDRVKLLQIRDKETPYGTRNNIIYRKGEEEHEYLVRGKYATLYDTVKMTTRVGMWSGGLFLFDALTPYDHDDLSFFPIFCYRRKRDGMPYGIVRDIRDPQSDLNKRRSKSLFMLSAHRVIYEKGAIDNPARFRDEMDRPDGIAEVNAGAISAQKVHIVNEQALATAHIELARDDAKFIQDIAGITDENLGKKTNATSGKAIEARQLQGMTTSGIVFDNHFHSFQLQGEWQLKLMEQYWDREKEFRISGNERKDEFAVTNQRGPDGQIINSMTRYPADFVVGKQDHRETIRMQMLEMFMNLITELSKAGMGKVALDLLDLAVELMDELSCKDEAVARIRKINGQEAPDDGLSPEEKQKKDQERIQRAQQMQAQQAVQKKLQDIEISIKEGEAAGKHAKALLDAVNAMAKQVEVFSKALDTAGKVQVAPQLVQAADSLIADAKVIHPDQQQVQQQPQQPVNPAEGVM